IQVTGRGLPAGQLNMTFLKCGQHCNLLLVLGDHSLECLAVFAFKTARDGQVDRQWIDVAITYTELVVQMRACRPARGPHVADQLPLLDLAAFFEALGKAALMSVQGGILAMMLQDDGLAIATLGPDKSHGAVGGGMNGRSGGGGVVDTIVIAIGAVNGVPAFSECRADPREF